MKARRPVERASCRCCMSFLLYSAPAAGAAGAAASFLKTKTDEDERVRCCMHEQKRFFYISKN